MRRPGSYVFIPDPASRRHAVAPEAGTTVLSFGGPAAVEPSNWETAWLSASRMHTDPDQARRLLREGLERDPDEALVWLRRSIERQPKCRAWARDEDDLASLREDPRFVELTVGGSYLLPEE
jgi:hypothetical protein